MEELKNNFIHDIIDADLAENPELKIHTRFPPEYMLLTITPLIISKRKHEFFSVQKAHCDFCILALLFAFQGYGIMKCPRILN